MKKNLNLNKKSLNLFKRLKIGIKKGWGVENLPADLRLLLSHPLFRIFRVVGGICFILVISKNILTFNIYIIYLVFFITFFYGLLILYINYKRIKHMYKILKEGTELDVYIKK
jgi:predicted membrane protein